MTAYVIVWNERKTEGVIFRNEMGDTGADDARHAADVWNTNSCATLADCFLETYGEDQSCFIQEIEIDSEDAKPAEDF